MSTNDANAGKPAVAFAHNLGTPAQVQSKMTGFVNAIAASTEINNKPMLADAIRNWLQGPPTARYSAPQIIENVKEANRAYKELYDLSEAEKFTVSRPTAQEIRLWGLEIDDDKIGESISDAIDYGDPDDLKELLTDYYSANFSTELYESVITPQPSQGGQVDPAAAKAAEEAATGDPVAKEQEKLEEKQEELQEKQENAKEGIKFVENIPLPYFVNDDYKTELGIIGNIFVNLRMLYQLALDDSLEDQDRKEKKDIALYDYIKNILTKISDSIGNVNNFDLFCDPVSNLMKIVDLNYVDRNAMKDANSPNDVYNNAFQLEMHNLKSTVRSYSMESKIFPEQSSIVAIGAQVGGGALGTDTTSLVAFNRFIIDRIIPIKDVPTDDLVNNEAQKKLEGLIKNLEVIYKFFGRLKSNWIQDADFDVDQAGGYANALKDLIEYFKQLTAPKSSNKAIIPTTLTVELDGIGGLIIGSIFKIPPDLLPKGYKGKDNNGFGSKLGYIMTGLGHTIKENDWVTKIEAQTIILDPPKAEVDNFDYSTITINITATTENNIIQRDTPPGDTPPGTPPTGNTNTGGTTKVFNGKTYQNGKVEELLVRMNPTLEKQHITSVCQSDGARVRLQAKAMQNLERMLKDAKAAGIHIGINSAYRTYEDQVRVKAASKSTGIPAATAGRSNHGFGLAVDLGNANGARVNPRKTPEEWKWIQANKYKYSFENINNTNESHHYNFYG